MKRLSIIVAIAIWVPATSQAWWDTKIDTVETRYPDSTLMEWYELAHFLGNERVAKTGFYRSWYPNGQPHEEGHYWFGAKTDVWVKWDSSGLRVAEANYLDSKIHGKETTWNPNGTHKSTAYYKNGKLHGMRTIFKAINTVGGFMSNPDLCIELKEFYVDGSLIVCIQGNKENPCKAINCGTPDSVFPCETTNQWVKIGHQCREFYIGHMIDGGKDGVWILWDESGDLMKIDFYRNGELVSD